LAGRGPAPQARRARGNADPVPATVLPLVKAKQPALPSFSVTYFDETTGKYRSQKFAWPVQTRTWWKMWADSSLSTDFTATDWSELLDTARLHAAYWTGDLKVAAELRLRVAKYGATPEDRARLRIQFAAADEAEKKASPAGDRGSARARRGPLRAV